MSSIWRPLSGTRPMVTTTSVNSWVRLPISGRETMILGMGGKLAARRRRFNEFGKLLEKIAGVIRAGGGFGMILDAENRQRFVPQPLDGVVVEIDVRNLHVARQRIRIDREPMVLRGDSHLPGGHILNRLVPAPMTKL